MPVLRNPTKLTLMQSRRQTLEPDCTRADGKRQGKLWRNCRRQMCGGDSSTNLRQASPHVSRGRAICGFEVVSGDWRRLNSVAGPSILDQERSRVSPNSFHAGCGCRIVDAITPAEDTDTGGAGWQESARTVATRGRLLTG